MKIKRKMLNDLINWKNSPIRKPLIVRGVRQCGKTWLLKEFGQLYFKNTAYFNFENENNLVKLFKSSITPEKIIIELEMLFGESLTPETLIIFDEIQAVPEALHSLKYFCEDKNEYAIIAAGSLLGITISAQVGFPVGKVNFMELTPCSFSEYLTAVEPDLSDYCENISELAPIPETFSQSLEEHLRMYLTLGGMPEVLTTFIENSDILMAESVQLDILQSYEFDFSKHTPFEDIPKLFSLWKSIPSQLAYKNDKFLYEDTKNFKGALRWLQEAGLISKITRITRPAIPLMAYEDCQTFKIYLTDTGILRKMAQVSASVILRNENIFDDYKCCLIKNYVQQQFTAMGIKPIYYWTGDYSSEMDFIIQSDELVLPIEVKSSLNRIRDSMQIYCDKYRPSIAISFSMQNLKLDDGLLNIPLYLINQLPRFLNMLQR